MNTSKLRLTNTEMHSSYVLAELIYTVFDFDITSRSPETVRNDLKSNKSFEICWFFFDKWLCFQVISSDFTCCQ